MKDDDVSCAAEQALLALRGVADGDDVVYGDIESLVRSRGIPWADPSTAAQEAQESQYVEKNGNVVKLTLP